MINSEIDRLTKDFFRFPNRQIRKIKAFLRRRKFYHMNREMFLKWYNANADRLNGFDSPPPPSVFDLFEIKSIMENGLNPKIWKYDLNNIKFLVKNDIIKKADYEKYLSEKASFDENMPELPKLPNTITLFLKWRRCIIISLKAGKISRIEGDVKRLSVYGDTFLMLGKISIKIADPFIEISKAKIRRFSVQSIENSVPYCSIKNETMYISTIKKSPNRFII